MIFLQNDAALIEGDGGKDSRMRQQGMDMPRKRRIYRRRRQAVQKGASDWKCPLKEGKELKADEIIGALHFPPTNDKQQASGFTHLLSQYGVKTCVYGHLHGSDAF